MIFNVNITERIAELQEGEDERLVCGNGGDQIKFTFDAEWNTHAKKTARFVWGKKYRDVEFTGDTVEIPFMKNTKVLSVGVYAGEEGEGEKPLSSTTVRIACRLGSRCGDSTPSAGTGKNYTNEAKGYAAECKKAVERAEEAADRAEDSSGMEQIGSLSIKAVLGYDDGGMEESQIGGVGIMDGILPLYAEYQATGYLIVNTYKDAIKGIFEGARIVELTIDKNNSLVPVENPVHKEMCKGGHMWYGTPKLIDDGMYGEIIGLGVNDLNDGTHLVYAVDVEDSEHTELLGLALSKGALLRINDVIYYSGSGEEVTLNFTAYR